MKSLFEQNGGTYSVVGDYRLPNLIAPNEPEFRIGIWGQRRLTYLKEHKRVLYVNLLTSGKLAEHLHEIDIAAQKRWEIIIRQMAEAQGVNEQVKSENQMFWIGRMNNIRSCVTEIIQNELIYD